MRSRSRRSVINISFTSCRQTQARINAWIISAAFCAIPAGLKGRAVRKGACYLNACCQSSHVFLLIILVHGDLPTDTCSHTSSLGAHGLFRDDGILVSFNTIARRPGARYPYPAADGGRGARCLHAASRHKRAAGVAHLAISISPRTSRKRKFKPTKNNCNSPPIKKLKEEPPTKAPVAPAPPALNPPTVMPTTHTDLTADKLQDKLPDLRRRHVYVHHNKFCWVDHDQEGHDNKNARSYLRALQRLTPSSGIHPAGL